MVLLKTTQEEPEMGNNKNEIPRVSYHNVSPFLSSSLKNEPDVTVANSHQIQHQLPTGTVSQLTIIPMCIISIRRNRLNSINTTQKILIRRDYV